MRRAFRAAIVALTMTFAACGKDSSSQPPATGGGAVILSIRTGDAQVAAPGAAVPSVPVILATNTVAQPLAGIAVTFTIDSGGGTVAIAKATTGADGTASPGGWTLGAREGANVLRVTATGANSLRIRAEARSAAITLVTDVSVPRTGGVVTVARPGSPLDGLRIVVPDSAYDGAAVFSIATRTVTPPALPVGYAQVGPALVVTNSQGTSTRPMAMTIPVTVSSPDSALAAFFFDSTTGTLELIPVAARTASTLTVVSRHFSSDKLLRRTSAARIAPVPATMRQLRTAAGYSPAVVIMVSVPTSRLNAVTTTGFTPGQDDWEYTNFGSITSPKGVCAGMSISAMYYFYALRGSQPLFGRYNLLATAQGRDYTNSAGLRLASVVQRTSADAVSAWEGLVDLFAFVSTVPKARLHYQSVVMAMQVTHMPQLLFLYGDGLAHAVVGYASQNGTVSFADPNAPGTSRMMEFANDAVVPFPFRSSGNSAPATVLRMETVGASVVIDDAALASLWQELANNVVGSALFPKAYLERFDEPTNTFVVIDTTKTTLVTNNEEFRVRTKCPESCEHAFRPDLLINTKVMDQSGNLLADGGQRFARVTLERGLQRLGILEYGVYNSVGSVSWSRFRWLYVNYEPVTITPISPLVAIESELTFTVTATALAPQVAKYTWEFNDATAPINTNVPTASHTYARVGNFKAKVTLYDAANTMLGRDSTIVTVGTLPLYGWSLRTATVQSSTLPPGGIGRERSDTLAYNFATRVISNLTATPSNSTIFVAGRAIAGPTCYAGAILDQAPPGATPVDTLVDANFVGLLGTCGDPDFTGSLIMGTLGNGTIIGSAAAVPSEDVIVVPGGSISATMSSRNLAGTFVWNVRYSTGIGTYTVVFTAVQVRPQ